MTQTATAIRIGIDRYGDAGVLHRVDAPVAPPGAGEVLIRQTAIGVNFVDIYFRSGAHALPALPDALGVEAAGVIEAVGPGVTDLVPGQRVAYAGMPTGSYASLRTMPAERVLPLPDGLSDEAAAAGLLKGITVYMLLHRVRHVGAGDTVLVHGGRRRRAAGDAMGACARRAGDRHGRVGRESRACSQAWRRRGRRLPRGGFRRGGPRVRRRRGSRLCDRRDRRRRADAHARRGPSVRDGREHRAGGRDRCAADVRSRRTGTGAVDRAGAAECARLHRA